MIIPLDTNLPISSADQRFLGSIVVPYRHMLPRLRTGIGSGIGGSIGGGIGGGVWHSPTTDLGTGEHEYGLGYEA